MNLNDKNNLNKNDGNKDGNPPFRNNTVIIFLIISIAVTFLISALTSLTQRPAEEISYNEFITMIEEKKIKKLEFNVDRIIIYPLTEEDLKAETEESVPTEEVPSKDISIFSPEFFKTYNESLQKAQEKVEVADTYYFTGHIEDPSLITRLNEHPEIEYYRVVQNDNPIISFLVAISPIVIFCLLISLLMSSFTKKMMGKGGFMSFGQSNAKVYLEKRTNVLYSDVAGQEEAKESLKEIVDFLHNPEKYTAIGAKQPKGALLVGPPGTGKTLLAKAVAGEARVAFFSLSGSDFVEMYVGVGASRVRDLFKQADAHAPCIIFIDEIDAIGKSRDTPMGGGNDEREQTLNQLLAEMDGFDSSRGVVILAATNRPEILDKALLRPGRFDRRIIVEKPDLKGREAVLAVHAKKVKMNSRVDLKQIALATSGAAGADLANIINEAALLAVKMEKKEVFQEHLLEAVEVIIAGKEKKDRILTEKDKRLVAFHEVGHALATAIQKNSQPVQKITIVPRTMGALGYILQMPEEERFIMTKDEILDQITVCLAGRAAEEIEFNMSTTGASNDIERATKLARSMVTQYGMSEKFGMMGLESIESKYLDGRAVLTCSDQTGGGIDIEVMNILEACHNKAKALLTENRDAMTRIAEYLIEKESITGEEFMDILKSIRGYI